MKDIVLNAQKRVEGEKTSTLRKEKMVPGVVYGNKKENIPLKFDASELLRIYRKAGESHVIVLNVEGQKMDVIIHDYQRHHITGDFNHMDLYAVTAGQTVNTAIKLEFVGESQAKKDGAIIEEYIKELEVSVLPKNLVDSFEVDLSLLKEVGDVIRVSDLNIDTSKFELEHDLEDIVAIASEPAKVEIEEEAPEFQEADVVGEESDENADEESEEK